MTSNRTFTALLIGRKHHTAWVLPQLLARAGFNVDIISSSSLMKSCKHVRHAEIVSPKASLIPVIKQMLSHEYDWIIVTEDATLTEVLHSELSIEDKLKVLPVLNEENFIHLHSKIGLSKVLAAKRIRTPKYCVANSLQEAILAAESIGYPVLVKIDSYCGGGGVFECVSPSDFNLVKYHIFDRPVLVQKKIKGKELDLSAIFFKGDLIHFSHATIKRVRTNKFGPSVLREYSTLSIVDKAIFEELKEIGKALGATGCTSISCIESEEKRYYFEVDMRPNAWINTPFYFEIDPAQRIREWFLNKKTLNYPVPLSSNQLAKRHIPYFLRLKRIELLCNCYQAWSFIPKDDLRLVIRLLTKHFFYFDIRNHFFEMLRRVIPLKYHNKLRMWKRKYLMHS